MSVPPRESEGVVAHPTQVPKLECGPLRLLGASDEDERSVVTLTDGTGTESAENPVVVALRNAIRPVDLQNLRPMWGTHRLRNRK